MAPGAPRPGGSPATDCVNGWTAALEGDADFGTALYLIERRMEVSGSWTVDEVRHFTGPDVTWTETPADLVERWYVKASHAVRLRQRRRIFRSARAAGPGGRLSE